MFWWILYEVATTGLNEYMHFYQAHDNHVQCIRTTFVVNMKRYAINGTTRAYLLPPIFVYGYLLPKFCWHWISMSFAAYVRR